MQTVNEKDMYINNQQPNKQKQTQTQKYSDTIQNRTYNAYLK